MADYADETAYPGDVQGQSVNVPKYMPTEQEKRLLSRIDRIYQDKNQTKRAYEKTWFINHAFLVGQQWLIYNDYARTFEIPFRIPRYRVRLISNRILPIWRLRLAKIMRSHPIWRVVPATHDDDDIARARQSERVLEAESRRERLLSKDHRVMSWATEAGSGFWKIYWDPTSGARIMASQFVAPGERRGRELAPPMQAQGGLMTEPGVAPRETGGFRTEPPGVPTLAQGEVASPSEALAPEDVVEMPMTDRGGQPSYFSLGNVRCDPVSPYEIEIDPRAKDMHDAQWVMHVTVRDLQWIRDHFQEKGMFVQREDITHQSFFERRIREIVGIFGYTTEMIYGGEAEKQKIGDIAIVKEYYERPSRDYPNGRMIVVAHGVLLYDGVFGDHVFWHPFVKADDIPANGRFWGMATIEQLIPLQKEFNRVRCCDISTYALTKRGWKSAFDILPADEILTYNQIKDRAEWQPIQRINRYDDYAGRLFSLESNQISSKTTEGHRWSVEHKVTRERSFVTNGPDLLEIPARHRKGTLNGEHVIPLARRVLNIPTRKRYKDDFVELLGWVATEGTYNKRSSCVIISQSETANPGKCARIRSLLGRLGAKTKGCRGGTATEWNLGKRLARRVRLAMPEKIPTPELLTQLTRSQLRLLIETMVAGDGHIHGVTKSGAKRMSLYTTDLRLADAAQMAAALIGVTARISPMPKSRSVWSRKMEYHIRFKTGRHGRVASVAKAIKEPEWYIGTVWCPTVKNGTWLARRNGHIYFTGNSQEIEDKNLAARPKVLVPKMCNINKTSFTSEPGEIIFYNPQAGLKPEWMDRGIEHIQVYRSIQDRNIQDMFEIAGAHEVSRGQIPPGVESGVAIDLLQEADDTQLEPTLLSFFEAKKEIGMRWLKLIKMNWTEARLVNAVGIDEEPETFWLSGDMIEGDDPMADYYNVDIQTGSALSLSKAARQQRITNLVNAGILNPVEDRRLILKYLDIGISEDLFEEDRLDEIQARKENRGMAGGELHQVLNYQNHLIHIREHNHYRKKSGFEQLPDQVKQIFEAHIQLHNQYILQAQMSIMAAAGPPGPGGRMLPEGVSARNGREQGEKQSRLARERAGKGSEPEEE